MLLYSIKKTLLKRFLLEKDEYNDVYNLYFDIERENEAINTFRNMLKNEQNYGPKTLFAAINYEILNEIDHSVTNSTEMTPKINLFRNGKLLVENYKIGYKPENKINPELWSLYQIQQQQLQQQQRELANINKNPGKKDKHELGSVYFMHLLMALYFSVSFGFIYVQLPNEKSSTEIWPWMTWNGVSSAYAGVFFRVTGGEAKSFGEVQEDNSPQLLSVETHCCDSQLSAKILDLSKSGVSEYIYNGDGDISDTHGWNHIKFLMKGGEVRPHNMAIRIWKGAG
jgi:hypothetical protein